MRLDVEVVAYRKMRYPTVGDYFRRKSGWVFRIAKFSDQRYSWLIFLHEVIEWTICRLKQISTREIDQFDILYEESRWLGKAPCGCEHWDEPGDDPHAPYREAHQVATACEKLIAKGLSVDWIAYEDEINALGADE